MLHEDLKRQTAFSGAKAFGYLKHLATTIGPRWTGSAKEHQAARYIRSEFKKMGLDAWLQEFPVRTFANKKFKFEAFDGSKWVTLNAQPVCMTQSVDKLEGEFYILESMDRQAWSEDMRDKIVLCTQRLNPGPRYEIIERYGPKAWVTIEGGIGVEAVRYAIDHAERQEWGDLPQVRLTHLDAVDIASKGWTRGRLTMHNEDSDSVAYNVIGELKGTEEPEEIVIVCAHYDSSFGISGASDNAAGTAVMMELARVLSKKPTRRTIRFIGFAAEETRLQGSKYYGWDLEQKAEKEKKRKSFDPKFDKTELEKHVFCFNIDVQGAVLGQHGFSYIGIDDIAASVRVLALEAGTPASINKGSAPMDGTAMAAVGIPTLQFARGGGTGGFMHTTYDDIRYLSADALARAGRFVELYLKRHFTQGVSLPFDRTIPEDLVKSIEWAKRTVPEKKSRKTTRTKSPRKTR
jgi:aminopeptidase YwaD